MAYIKPQDAINDSNIIRSATQNSIFDALGLKADVSYVNTLVPSQSGNSGKYLYTNGSVTSWESITFPPAGANTSLSNLASVAINEDLLFGTDGAKNIGAASASRPNNLFVKNRINSVNVQTKKIASFNLTGTHSVNGATVTGVGSAYLSELNIGDSVSFSGFSSNTYTVLAISSDTSFTTVNTGQTVSGQTITVYKGSFTSLDDSGNVKTVLNGSDVFRVQGQVLDSSGWNNRAALMSLYNGYNDGDTGISGGLNAAQFVTPPPSSKTQWAVLNHSTNFGTPSVSQNGYGFYNESGTGNSNTTYTNNYWFHNGSGNLKGVSFSTLTDRNNTGIEILASSSAQTAIGAQFKAGAFFGGSGATGYGVVSLASSLSAPTRAVGGLFLVGDGSVLTTDVNAALVADNTSTTYSIAVFKANGTNKVVIDNSGNLNVANLTASTLLASDASKNIVSFANGLDGYVLTMVSGAPVWAPAAGGGMTNPMTTAGDIIVGGASGTPTRLGLGTVDKVLVSDGTTVSYQYAGLGGGAFGTNNVILGRGKPSSLSTSTGSILINTSAGNALTAGNNNILMGVSAGAALTTQSNQIAIGHSALSSMNNTTLVGNAIAVGFESLKAATTVQDDSGIPTIKGAIAIGYQAGYQATSISSCIYIGWQAGRASGGHTQNTYIGHLAGNGGNSNIAIGTQALNTITAGARSIAIGNRCAVSATSNDNVGIGDSALGSLLGGTGNSALGSASGATVTVGTNNTMLGMQTGTALSNTSGAIALGRSAVAGSNEFGVGSSTAQINSVLLGRGGAAQATANAVTVMTMRASGTADTGMTAGTLTLAGSQGTGLGEGGDVLIATAPAAALSGTTTNAHVEIMRVTAKKEIKLTGGGVSFKSLHGQTGTVTATVADMYIGCNTAAAVAVNLPTAASAGAGKMYIIKDETGQALSNNITITPNGSEKIDTAGNYVIANNFQSITLVCDGSNWFII